MTKYKIATALSALYLTLLSDAFASQVKVSNNTDDTIHVFFRGKESKKSPHVESVPAHSSQTFIITDEYIDNQFLFQAIASTNRRGNPDWKLLAGTCDELNKDTDYTLIIETTKMGLKTSCTSISQ